MSEFSKRGGTRKFYAFPIQTTGNIHNSNSKTQTLLNMPQVTKRTREETPDLFTLEKKKIESIESMSEETLMEELQKLQ